MKIGIMQPYFFPYLGHFALIASVDEWVVFDVTQYTPKTWMNRNRILHPTQGWQYITVPLANSSIGIKTYDARVADLSKARQHILGKLTHYKKYAPFYREVVDLVEYTFESTKVDSLVSLNLNALVAVCDYLKLPFNYSVASELNFDYPKIMLPGDWAPFICTQLGADEYVNPLGGEKIFDLDHFKKNGLALHFLDFEGFQYKTGPYQFESSLSVIDVLMWNTPEYVNAAIYNGISLQKVC